MLHLEVIYDRLLREFDLDLILTAPSVSYQVTCSNGKVLNIHNPSDMPESTKIVQVAEPWVQATIILPANYLGNVMDLCSSKRGEQVEMSYNGERTLLVYNLPLSEIVFGFYDQIKSITKGYASLDWHVSEYRKSQITRLSVLIDHQVVDSLTYLVYKPYSERIGRSVCEKLKTAILRQQYKVAIQAQADGKILARETIQPYQRCDSQAVWGDRTRKMKLLAKQKKGKKG